MASHSKDEFDTRLGGSTNGVFGVLHTVSAEAPVAPNSPSAKAETGTCFIPISDPLPQEIPISPQWMLCRTISTDRVL
jgi:hypothetical protein